MDEEQMHEKLGEVLEEELKEIKKNIEIQEQFIQERILKIGLDENTTKVEETNRYKSLLSNKEQLETEIKKYSNKSYLTEPQELSKCKEELQKVYAEIKFIFKLEYEIEEAKKALTENKHRQEQIQEDIELWKKYYSNRINPKEEKTMQSKMKIALKKKEDASKALKQAEDGNKEQLEYEYLEAIKKLEIIKKENERRREEWENIFRKVNLLYEKYNVMERIQEDEKKRKRALRLNLGTKRGIKAFFCMNEKGMSIKHTIRNSKKFRRSIHIGTQEIKDILEMYNTNRKLFMERVLTVLLKSTSHPILKGELNNYSLDDIYKIIESYTFIDRKVFDMIDPTIVLGIEKLYDRGIIESSEKKGTKEKYNFLERYLQMYNLKLSKRYNAMYDFRKEKVPKIEIIYDLKRLSKPYSYFDRRRGEYLSLLEKAQINQKAMLAEELGIAETKGLFRPSFIDRFFERIGVKQIEEKHTSNSNKKNNDNNWSKKKLPADRNTLDEIKRETMEMHEDKTRFWLFKKFRRKRRFWRR